MAKPTITTRAGKGAALTYTELDTNFSNIKDATITLTGGSTAVTADLNGNISLVAGTNVTITGDNSAKTITIASSGAGGSGTVNSGSSGRFAFYPSAGTTVDDTTTLSVVSGIVTMGSNLNLNGNYLSSGGVGKILVDDDIAFNSGEGPVVSSGGQLLCRGGTITLQVTNDPGLELSGVVTGTPSNTSTPATYLKITVNGTLRYIPLYS
jgi:hypothetical protein